MHCPYCTSEIDDAALVCPQCSRDLYLVKQLQAKIDTLEAALAEQQAAAPVTVETTEAAPVDSPAPVTAPASWWKSVLSFWLPPLLLLLLAHFLLTVVYDINTLYLRIASILIPLPFGLLLMRQRRSFAAWLGAGFVLALLAVLGMSKVIAMVDQVPVLPADAREWREFLEYAASIGFSYTTGMILGCLMRPQSLGKGDGIADRLIALFVDEKSKAQRLHKLAEKLNDVGSSVVAMGTTAISIYTGIKDFLGN